jgi:hypothetical protein
VDAGLARLQSEFWRSLLHRADVRLTDITDRRVLPMLPVAEPLGRYATATLAPSKGMVAASNNRATWTADQFPPRAAAMPRSSKPAAMARNDSQPASCSS